MTTETTNTKNTAVATGTKNDPNARILIYALQHLGYDNHVALCDIIDNSIDANATEIRIYVDNKNDDFRIIIQDNGTGMSMEELDEALKLGSDSVHDPLSDLGKYGMGLSTAGLSLADKTTILTKTEDAEVLKSATDVETIKGENAFVKFLGEANEQEKLFFRAQLGDSPSGTIIILENCFGVKNKKVSQFAGKLIREIARKYRKFMDSIDFYVNDKHVSAEDPLMLTGTEKGYEAEIYSDDEYEVNWVDKVTGNKLTGKVHVKLVLLPDCSEAKAKELGINMKNQGFSVLRNNREIAFGFMPWHIKHNSLNRVRGELSFDAFLDEAMGVNFTKKDIDMVDSVDDVLRHMLKPQIDSMRTKSQRSQKVSGEEKSSHDEAAEAINKKGKVLITPPEKKEKSSLQKTIKGQEAQRKLSVKESSSDTTKKERRGGANVRFETASMRQNGPIFEAEQQGKTIVICWNTDHPFYTRFVRENADNKTLVTSVDFLIYSLAAAQIQAAGDDNDKAIMIDTIISTMSTNMRVLLS